MKIFIKCLCIILILILFLRLPFAFSSTVETLGDITRKVDSATSIAIRLFGLNGNFNQNVVSPDTTVEENLPSYDEIIKTIMPIAVPDVIYNDYWYVNSIDNCVYKVEHNGASYYTLKMSIYVKGYDGGGARDWYINCYWINPIPIVKNVDDEFPYVNIDGTTIGGNEVYCTTNIYNQIGMYLLPMYSFNDVYWKEHDILNAFYYSWASWSEWEVSDITLNDFMLDLYNEYSYLFDKGES